MPEQRRAAVKVETTECHGCLVQKYIVIDQECCTVRQWSGSQPPFHPSAVSSYSSTVGMNWSSHNEAFSSQLCSSGFQFHTQPSVSPLNGHHCPRHMQRTTDPFHSAPSSCCRVPPCPPVSLSLSSVIHTQSHTVTLLIWSRLCLWLYTNRLTGTPSQKTSTCAWFRRKKKKSKPVLQILAFCLCLYPPHLSTLSWCLSLRAPLMSVCPPVWILVEPDIPLQWRWRAGWVS